MEPLGGKHEITAEWLTEALTEREGSGACRRGACPR